MTTPRVTVRALVLAGLVLAVVLVFVISPFASSSPDGLQRVAIDEGFDQEAGDHRLAEAPLADYAVGGRDSRLGSGVAGAVGVAVVFGVSIGVLVVVRRRDAPSVAEP